MAKQSRSARGEIVDFDILQIKQALAAAPISVGTEERRQFIDTKNGLKPKAKNVQNALKILPEPAKSLTDIPEAMKMAMEAAAMAQEDDEFETAPEE